MAPKNQKNVSLLELNEKAHQRVEEIRRANAQKSQQKIKELTEEHQRQKKNALAKKDDVVLDDSDGEGEEESKAAGKKNGNRR